MDTSATPAAERRIVLGLGGTVDHLVTWDSDVVEQLALAYGIGADELDVDVPVSTERDLLRVLLAFVRDGSGGERFVASAAVVEQFSARFEREIVLGGTCVRAGMGMDVLGVPSTLHLVSIDDHVRRLLPSRCRYVCSATEDSTDPHLIIQFAAGTRVRVGDVDLRAPHPNRVIFANDPPNRELRISDELADVLVGAQVFLVSGFNVIQDPADLDDRLDTVGGLIAGLEPDCLVHYEDSGFHQPALAHRVNARLGPLVGVHGLNEDELQAYLGRPVDLLDVEDVVAALGELRRLVSAPTLVLHTRFWSLVEGPQPATYVRALEGGITMASSRYLHGDAFTAADYEELGGAPRNPAGVRFARQVEAWRPGRIRCRPALNLRTDHPHTIGLGDTFVGGFLEAWARP